MMNQVKTYNEMIDCFNETTKRNVESINKTFERFIMQMPKPINITAKTETAKNDAK